MEGLGVVAQRGCCVGGSGGLTEDAFSDPGPLPARLGTSSDGPLAHKAPRHSRESGGRCGGEGRPRSTITRERPGRPRDPGRRPGRAVRASAGTRGQRPRQDQSAGASTRQDSPRKAGGTPRRQHAGSVTPGVTRRSEGNAPRCRPFLTIRATAGMRKAHHQQVTGEFRAIGYRVSLRNESNCANFGR